MKISHHINSLKKVACTANDSLLCSPRSTTRLLAQHLVMLAGLSFVKMPFFSLGTDNHLVAPSASGESICMLFNQRHAAVRLNSALH